RTASGSFSVMSRFFSFRKCFDRLVLSTRLPQRKRARTRPKLEELECRFAPALSIADSSVLEPAPGGTATMNFTVTPTGDLTVPLIVSYTTVAGTAQPAADFTPQTGTTTFAAGSDTATIGIPIIGNGLYNTANLTFSVKVTTFLEQQTFAA